MDDRLEGGSLKTTWSREMIVETWKTDRRGEEGVPGDRKSVV